MALLARSMATPKGHHERPQSAQWPVRDGLGPTPGARSRAAEVGAPADTVRSDHRKSECMLE
eukprot:3555228-Prymnesium_polylepis.1